MKKTLAAVAVLGAFAGSALAAEVQLYGIVDLGVGYSHTDADGLLTDSNDQALSEQTKDSFQMKSGQGSGSRWGIKGTEDLGNGLKVGFILEDGFDADDGTEDSTDVMFNRESSLLAVWAPSTPVSLPGLRSACSAPSVPLTGADILLSSAISFLSPASGTT